MNSNNFLSNNSSNFSTLTMIIKSIVGEKSIRHHAIVLSILNIVFKITTPLMQGMIMACGLKGGLPFLTDIGFGMIEQVGALAVFYYISASLDKYLEYKRKQKWTEYANKIESSLRNKSYQHIHLLPMAVLAENEWSSTELTNFVRDDSEQVKKFLEFGAPNVLDKLLTFITCSVLLLSVSPIAFLLAMIPMPFMFAMSGKFNRENQLRHKSVGIRKKELNNAIINGVNGLPTVKSFTAEEWENNRLATLNNDYEKTYNHSTNERFKHYAKLQFGFYLGVGLPIIFTTFGVYQGSIGIATFAGIAFLLPQMILATQGLDQDYAFFQSASSSAKRLKKLLTALKENVLGEKLIESEVKGEIKFEGVSFSYSSVKKTDEELDDSKQSAVLHSNSSNNLIIDNLTLTIPAGGVVALVGGTGSGKSTLVKLLLRFYEPTKGRILLDGKDIKNINVSDLRKSLGWVSQDVYLFEGSIGENICYGTQDASQKDIENVARLAEATDFIEGRDNQFNEEVGERGLSLSGGQRQRISVARALLKNAPILILDEATSAVDNLTESEIHKNIITQQMGRTLMLVAHRLSTVARADSIYVFENGVICESGTHKELLSLEGVYAQLWDLQLNV